jgi:transcriptional regulator with XRE-family HTH domain
LTSLVKIKIINLKTTGEIIREKREELGLLLRELAASLKIDPAIMSKIERGGRKPTKEQLIKIAKLLGLDKKELILSWISDKIVYEIRDEEYGVEALKIAEKKIEYLKKKKS